MERLIGPQRVHRQIIYGRWRVLLSGRGRSASLGSGIRAAQRPGLLAKRLSGCCRRVRNLINNTALTSNTGDSVNQAGLTVVKILV